MLDDFVIGQILEREKQKRKEAEWQPAPLYLPIDDVPSPRRTPKYDSEDESGEIRIDLWEPEEKSDIIVIQTSYKPHKLYQN